MALKLLPKSGVWCRAEADLALKFSSISEACGVSGGTGFKLHRFHLFLQQFTKYPLSFPCNQPDEERSGGSETAWCWAAWVARGRNAEHSQPPVAGLATGIS